MVHDPPAMYRWRSITGHFGKTVSDTVRNRDCERRIRVFAVPEFPPPYPGLGTVAINAISRINPDRSSHDRRFCRGCLRNVSRWYHSGGSVRPAAHISHEPHPPPVIKPVSAHRFPICVGKCCKPFHQRFLCCTVSHFRFLLQDTA